MHFKSITYASPQPGPRLIVLGAVHGNELAGTKGILRVIEELESGQVALAQGRVTFVPITNPLAYEKQQRAGDRNLNRNLSPTKDINEFEDQIANWLCPLLAEHEVLLDLHSFQAQGKAFAMIGPLDNTGPLEPFSHAAKEEALALRLGVDRIVDGWLATYAGGVERRLARLGNNASRKDLLLADAKYGVGTTEYMRSQGGWSITLECGQHNDPHAPEVAYRAIRNTLAHLGLVAEADPAPAREVEALHLFTVIDKLDAADTFAKPWTSFDAVSAGEVIGTRANGEVVKAECDGRIVFPNAKAGAGEEWFYLAQHNARFDA
ncbi:succinylglutamate desuccinylase/aspartoacylase family protein [Chitinimonas sp. BJYL2]|uniref:succinylglutamate desuccinylase/aspartoacylase domain-containing protein n=1 Tax=Chitinimonas sp. BJYL2 TaxID=2976696 RepID=UPI0022B43D14|nr:succinylglutamate desuccinylase/aspartoacylase family protein [Chitinimonas sp. BJYL2]